MDSEHTDRRTWFARMGAAGAAAAVGPAVLAARASGEAPAGDIGEVAQADSGGTVRVALEADGREVAGQADGARGLRKGDRVVVNETADGARVMPLYLTVEGPVELATADTLVIGGVECRRDAQSVLYGTAANDVAPAALQRSAALGRSRRVGALCIENRADGSRTIDALYLM